MYIIIKYTCVIVVKFSIVAVSVIEELAFTVMKNIS